MLDRSLCIECVVSCRQNLAWNWCIMFVCLSQRCPCHKVCCNASKHNPRRALCKSLLVFSFGTACPCHPECYGVSKHNPCHAFRRGPWVFSFGAARPCRRECCNVSKHSPCSALRRSLLVFSFGTACPCHPECCAGVFLNTTLVRRSAAGQNPCVSECPHSEQEP